MQGATNAVDVIDDVIHSLYEAPCRWAGAVVESVFVANADDRISYTLTHLHTHTHAC